MKPPHDEFCPRCYPEPSWGALAATVGTLLALAAFVLAAVLIGTNVALWAAVGGR